MNNHDPSPTPQAPESQTPLGAPGAPSAALDGLLAQSPLPALDGPLGVAERLVLLVHRGVDFDIWGGARRVRYWDAYTDRVRAATYAGPTLSHWWQEVSLQITSTPRSAEDRANIAALIAHPAQRPALDALYEHAATLVLRVRVLSEARAMARQHQPAPGEQTS